MIHRLRFVLPWAFLVSGTTALFAVVDRGFPPWTALGFVLGTFLGQEPLSDLWLLLTHRLTGARHVIASYGHGRLLWHGTVAGVPVSVGMRPTTGLRLSWGLLPVRAARLRFWACSVGWLAVHAGLGVWLAASCTGLARGVGLGLLSTLALILLLQGPTPVNSAWAVLVMPFRPRALDPHLWSTRDLAAERLLCRGLIPEARAALDGPAPAWSGRTRLSAAGVALAEGRYDEADRIVALALEQGCDPGQAYGVAAMVIVCRGDSGELAPARAGALLGPALEVFGHNDHAKLRSVLAAADLARFNGDPEVAVRAARRHTVEAQLSPYWRAHAGCSLAAALIAAGKPEQARKALDRARRACPGLSRIADVERLLERPVEVA
ncbi:tetratricopeptide repeat protein [Kitasatospora sp. NPDC056184]|uniref:tetratricopeptide repeat protein n=1 Tax=Kitasatospora sp. NPDC056184 TaxID=3345738 RepID=UPI0035E2FD15